MSTDGNSNCNADTLAGNLFTNLVAGENFDLPATDLTGAEYQVPSTTGNDLYSAIPDLTLAEVTDRTLNGTGVFDGLMEVLNLHLESQYEAGRISGKEFAQAYVEMTTMAMQSAMQFVMGKENAKWTAALTQQQARAAEIAVVTERTNLAAMKAKMRTQEIEARLAASNFALAKMKLSTEDAQYCAIQAQTSQTNYQTDTLMPAQVAQVQKETARLTYEVDYLLPQELLKAQKQVDALTGEISNLTARTNQVLYQTANILPAELAGIDKDTAIKDYQLTSQLPAQVAGITADTAGKVYTNDHLLPAQLSSLNEQTEAHRAKTLDTRTDGSTVRGSVGVQKDLQTQQIASYISDSKAKVGKIFMDSWITQKSLDDGLLPPTSIGDTYLNTVFDGLRSDVGLT